MVLAGGQGSRFWPRSSDETPKQFLDLFGTESLLRSTVRRLERWLPVEDISVVTGARHQALVAEHLPHLPPENILVEPGRRDTAAAVGYACLELAERDPEAVAVVVPADHLVHDVDRWVEALADSARYAGRTGRPVLIGIPPSRPETNYGYILLSDEVAGRKMGSSRIYPVARFIEKPDPDLAARLIAGNRCLWNSGMFVWRVRTALELIRQHLPQTYGLLAEIQRHSRDAGAGPGAAEDRRRTVAALYARIHPTSIDYGVLERARDVVATLGEFDWDDVGGWEAVARVVAADPQGNVALGPAAYTLDDTTDCVIDWPGDRAVVVGVKGLVVAAHGGSLLVCSRERLTDLKRLLAGTPPSGPVRGKDDE